MTARFIGKPMKRNEDALLLTGRALFTDDVHLPDMLHVAFVRSDYAHGRILGIDTEFAEEIPGVVAIITAEDLGDYWQPGPLLVPPPPVEGKVFHARTQAPLAKDKVRHVGEAIAMVVAESRYIAEDAVEQIFVDIEPLPAVTGLEEALKPDAALIHEDLDSNLAAHIIQQKGDYAAAKEKADVVIKRRFYYDHGIAAAMENRGIVAWWDDKMQRLTLWDTTQAPVVIRNGLAAMLGLSESQVRVIAPFIGGAFGPKIMMFYPEEVLLAWSALKLNRPLKWIEDRRENFMSTTQERDQIHWAEIALTKDGKILGVKDEFIHDSGAYDPYGLTVPINSQCTLLGSYDIPNYYSDMKVVFTNKMYVTPYRGAGRQHGVFVMERLLDIAARELGMSIPEIRRVNFIPPDKFPYNNEIIYQDFAPLRYDSGNYEPVLDKALELIEYEKFIKEEQPRYRAQGRHVGIGVVAYVEGTGIGPYEGARVQVESTGKINVSTGVGTQGQGHFTSFVQVVAEQLGVDPSTIHLVTGDTDQFHWGTGTFASRGMVVAGNAINNAAEAVRNKILSMASEHLEAPVEDLELKDGFVIDTRHPESIVALKTLATLANPLRGAVKADAAPGLEATGYFGPESGVTAHGVHAMILEIDPETMMIKILRYVAAHDCGVIINPLIVDGQVQGGVAQGIGNAYYEKIVYDENGQLLTASFADYLIPTSMEVPHIELWHQETPSPLNKLGVKGVGEAGAIPVGPLFAQAVENALADYDVEITEIPLSPNRLFEILEAARAKM